MAFTTPKAIIDGLYSLIKSLDPDGKAAGGGYRFEPRSGATTWDDVPDSDKDRRFTIEALTRSEIQMFGTINEIDYGGTCQVHIMHNISKEERDGMVRRDADLYQIAEELEKKANWATYLTGVSLVRFNSQTIRKLDNHWYSILTFRINFALAAP
jgi:hypothetical protein